VKSEGKEPSWSSLQERRISLWLRKLRLQLNSWDRVETLFDVGVAGIHRLLSERERLEAARVLVVVAGMEGALPSVVADW